MVVVMGLAPWVRDRLWRANNWCGELAQLRQSVAAEPRSAKTLERMFELAWATEYCDPDRGRALALYLDAWRGGHAGARERAKALALGLRAHMTLAEIALAEGDFVAAGAAYLDAGFPDLAVEPLQRFVNARPPGASPATENVRLEGVKALLALRVDRASMPSAKSPMHSRAPTTQPGVPPSRPTSTPFGSRASNLDDRVASVLAAATRACPDDDEISALVETRLLEKGDADAVLEHYRMRFERSSTREDYVERVARQASR